MSRPALPGVRAAVLAAALALAGAARADDVAAPPASPEAPRLTLESLELLPLDEFGRQDLREAHPDLARRLEALASRVRDLEGRLAKREKKDDEEGLRLAAQVEGLRLAADVTLLELRELLRPRGLTDDLVAALARAPRGPGRVERHARGLVLLLPDLSPAQRATLERVVAAVDGATLAGRALSERTDLAVQQAGLTEAQARSVREAFRRQSVETDRRFWRLVDYVLGDAQKAALWSMLPTPLRQHDTPEEHVYALPGIAPAQAARVKALVTEVEAESAPDQALLKRVREELGRPGLAKERIEELQRQSSEAQARLTALRRRAQETGREILGPELSRAFEAIPPRVAIYERREEGARLREGMTLSPEQAAALEALQREATEVGRRIQARLQSIRGEGADAGPDSPQQTMMEMRMAGARGEAQAAQRALIGRMVLEVLTPDQVDGWVLGVYGARR